MNGSVSDLLREDRGLSLDLLFSANRYFTNLFLAMGSLSTATHKTDILNIILEQIAADWSQSTSCGKMIVLSKSDYFYCYAYFTRMTEESLHNIG